MLKKAILFLGAAIVIAGSAFGQHAVVPCATDEVHKALLKQHPEIAAKEALLNKHYQDDMVRRILSSGVASKGTNAAWNTRVGYDANDTEYHIPVVVHIIHNYGTEYVADDKVYQMISDMNTHYHAANSDIGSVIQPFKEYIGNAHITFHLATIDPTGQPTNGITRHYSYLTGGGDELAKFDEWNPDRYFNIWVENHIGEAIANGVVLAYSRFPADGANTPYGDGVIVGAPFITDGTTVAHEAGHYFNLLHVWNSNGEGAGEGPDCGDDAVDDTPPTIGHFSTCPLYDTVCAKGYKKVYGLLPNTQTIDFPDTANVQNIMDYSSCTNMFTIGQVERMRDALTDETVTRHYLKDSANLVRTGVMTPAGTVVPRPNLAPVADFSVNRNFVCATTGTTVTFTDRSWRDTIASRSWTFSNGNPATSTSAGPAEAFTTPGWVTATLAATGNGAGAGTGTITRSDLVYAADPNPVQPNDYYGEFNTANGGDADKYPIFNYYGLNDYKWALSQYGAYDNTGMMFHNYDSRIIPDLNTATNSPKGSYSDFFTPAFDLSAGQFSAVNACKLTYMSSGAFRTINPSYMNDTLQISYSVNCGVSWVVMTNVTKGDISNKGYISYAWYPSGPGDWKVNGLTVPAGAKTNKTFFRFRYIPGTDNGNLYGVQTPNGSLVPWGTGNNFFLDRINVTSNSVGVNTQELAAKGITLYPNPTNGGATLTIQGGDNSLAEVNVTDVTGKVVYRTEVRLTTEQTQVEIPASNVAVKGLYMVHVIANGKSQAQKLVVY